MLTLNPQQAKSVQHTEGHSLVIAGAGSGKTRTLIAKIVYLIETKKVSPYNILAITFTNKAAKEMRERIQTFSLNSATPHQWGGLQIRTFHSWGAVILRLFIDEMSFLHTKKETNQGYQKNFSIIDPDDQKKIIRQLYPDYSTSEFPLKKYLFLISAWKNDFLYPDDEDFGERARSYYEDIGFVVDPIELYQNYIHFMVTNNILDFDDLIGLTVKLLQRSPRVARYVQERWEHLLVDEYQDTNHAQEKIIEFFIHQGSKVTVVGDDQQSIYGFRGAQMDNILSFKKKYPQVQIFILEENYRSTQPILNLANHVIAKNPSIFKKNLFTKNISGEMPIYGHFSHDVEETNWVIEKIITLKEVYPLNEIAIFYRTNYQSRIIEDVLIRSNIPYHIVKGQKFYERKEIKDLLAYLIWLVNPHDRIAFERFINTPPRRLGEKTLTKIYDYLDQEDISLSEVFDHESIVHLINDRKANQAFIELSELFRTVKQKQKEGVAVIRMVNYVLQKSGLQKLYEEEKDAMIRDQRLGNLDSFFNALELFVKETGGGLEDFILSISLGDHSEEENLKSLQLMTVHNAKGLEFKMVFIIGLEEGVFPHQLTLDSDKEIEEERRLFYVAITRAKERLYLSSSAIKYHYNSMNHYIESRFITEIDPQYLIKETPDTNHGGDDSSTRYDGSDHPYY